MRLVLVAPALVAGALGLVAVGTPSPGKELLLRPEARGAFARLLKAKAIDDPLDNPRGYSRDLRQVTRDPEAVEAFLELTKRGTPAGRIYGLAGLWGTSRDQFRAAAARMAKESGVFVNIMISDFAQPVPMPEVVELVRRGDLAP